MTTPDPSSQQHSGTSPSLTEILHRHFSSEAKKKTEPPPPPPLQKEIRILRWLRPLPWLLLGLFLFSFFWDFGGMQISFLTITLPLDGLLRIISVSGLIGFLTNWVAITMLFKPVMRRPLLGQGLIPAHKERIAYRLSAAVAEDLINPELIRQKVEESDAVRRYRKLVLRQLEQVTRKPEFRTEIKNWVVHYIRSVLQDEQVKRRISSQIVQEIEHSVSNRPIERTALRTYALLRGKNLEQLVETSLEDIPFSMERNEGVMDDLLDSLPENLRTNSEEIEDVVTNLIFSLINRLNVQKLVEENLREYDESRLELMIRNATSEQLKTIQYLGAVLGTIGGFVIWQPVWSLGVLGSVAGMIFLADYLLYGR